MGEGKGIREGRVVCFRRVSFGRERFGLVMCFSVIVSMTGHVYGDFCGI
jgi:hypothetical protein